MVSVSTRAMSLGDTSARAAAMAGKVNDCNVRDSCTPSKAQSQLIFARALPKPQKTSSHGQQWSLLPTRTPTIWGVASFVYTHSIWPLEMYESGDVMPVFSKIASQVSVSSADLNLLRGILDEWCLENSVKITSDAAAEKAGALIDWFQFGIKDRIQLKAMLSPIELCIA